MEINGVAHTFICTGDFAKAREFYGKLLPFLGLRIVADAPGLFYCVGGRTGFGIEAAKPEYAGQRFIQGSVGLHHHCWRARSREDVDAVHTLPERDRCAYRARAARRQFRARLLLGAV
jgi:catechol 2,3-dioxygenase-like lactoylglutathione lyase family enzyme